MEAGSPEDAPVSRVVLLDARLEQQVETSRVEVRRIRMKAGVIAGRHVHNGPVFGTVVSGSVLFEVAGETSKILRAGDVFYEPADAAINHFDARDEDVEFIGFFLLQNDQAPEIMFTD